jgi:hypothetical protein
MPLSGAYSIDITPDHQVDLNGYILRFGRSEGVHDPLTANFLYIESEGKKMLLVSLDILTISHETSDKLRDQVSGLFGIEREAILFAAIHTHAAVGSPYLRNVGKESPEWLCYFEQQIIEGTKKAIENAAESSFYAYEAYSHAGINRRKNTRGIDPNTPFIIVKSNNKITAAIINYNCHAVCLTENNQQVSADYVYYMRECLYEQLGVQFPVIFFNGGSGDVDPVKRGSFSEAKFVGRSLAEEILLNYKVYDGVKLGPVLSYKEAPLVIPYNWKPSVKEAEANLAEYTQRFENAKTKEDIKIAGAFLLWAKDVLDKTESGTLPEKLNLNISSFMIGKALFIAVPLEIFSSISLKLRKYFAEFYPFIVSYGNGYSGYLSDKAAHFEGGYETDDWHKYAGILPKVPNVEDIFWKSLKELKLNNR